MTMFLKIFSFDVRNQVFALGLEIILQVTGTLFESATVYVF